MHVFVILCSSFVRNNDMIHLVLETDKGHSWAFNSNK